MGEGTTPLLEGLAWVTSLCVIYLFFSKIKKKMSRQLVLKLVHKKKKEKEKNKNQELFGQRKIKPVGWSLVGFTNFRRKSFAQLSENSTLIINYSVIISLQRSTQNCVTNVTLPLNKYSNKRVSQIILMQCIQHS